jgi:hypothetical protein
MTLYHKFMDGTALVDVTWHPDELLGYQFDFGNGQDYLVKSLKSDRKVVAVRTADSALKLAMHQVDNDGL